MIKLFEIQQLINFLKISFLKKNIFKIDLWIEEETRFKNRLFHVIYQFNNQETFASSFFYNQEKFYYASSYGKTTPIVVKWLTSSNGTQRKLVTKFLQTTPDFSEILQPTYFQSKEDLINKLKIRYKDYLYTFNRIDYTKKHIFIQFRNLTLKIYFLLTFKAELLWNFLDIYFPIFDQYNNSNPEFQFSWKMCMRPRRKVHCFCASCVEQRKKYPEHYLHQEDIRDGEIVIFKNITQQKELKIRITKDLKVEFTKKIRNLINLKQLLKRRLGGFLNEINSIK